MKSQFQIELLQVGGQPSLSFNGGLKVAVLTSVNGIAFLPDIFPIFVNVVAFVAGNAVVLSVLLVREENGTSRFIGPNGGLYLENIAHLIMSHDQKGPCEEDQCNGGR